MRRNPIQNLCCSLNVRRQQLRMTFGILARRSGVSLPTVRRTLAGRNPNASLGNVAAIAETLGMRIGLEQTEGVGDFLERQATRKARRLSGIVQGTMGLESQAVNPGELNDMTRQTVHELLAGSPRRLWSE